MSHESAESDHQANDRVGRLHDALTRIMAGLLFATIVVSLGWIISSNQGTSTEYLFGGTVFTDDELQRAEEAFGTAALADYQREGMRIKVPRDKKDLYLKALSASDAMPEEWGRKIDRALTSSNPFEPTDLIEKRYQAARERELAGIIRRIPPIDFASVEYDENRQGFARNVDRTASVQVSARGRKIDSAVLRHIAQMTASYFAGLKLENITVMDLGGMNMYRGNSNPNAPDQQPLLQAQIEWQQHYMSLIQPSLDHYGDVKLLVGVEIDPTLQKESEQLKYDQQVITLQSQTSKKDTENTKLSPGGRPGADPNAISNQPQSIAQTPANPSQRQRDERKR